MGANFRRSETLVEDAKAFTPVAAGSGAAFGPGHLANCLWVGASGTVTIVKDNDETLLFTGVLAGLWHNCPPFKRINAVGTTATSILVGITFRV